MPAAGREGRALSAVWRALAVFGGVAGGLIAVGAGVLQVLGPPGGRAPHGVAPVVGPAVVSSAVVSSTEAHGAAPAVVSSAPVAGHAAAERGAEAVAPVRAVAVAALAPGAAVPGPDPRLQEPAPSYPGLTLPRVGPGGGKAMQAYAAGFDRSDLRPHVAVLMSGLGMSGPESEEAIRALPAAVSLAFSPYAARPQPLLEAARARGHEVLLALPLEPTNYPINDAGNQALLARAAPEVNAARLEWVLSRFAGYVGATGALGRLRGERFAASDQMAGLLEELGRRGVFYVDPRVEGGAGLRVDLVIDEPAVRTEIDARLARLEAMARDRGAALGLVGGTTPVVTERLAAWAATLSQRGFSLVPVSALPREARP